MSVSRRQFMTYVGSTAAGLGLASCSRDTGTGEESSGTPLALAW